MDQPRHPSRGALAGVFLLIFLVTASLALVACGGGSSGSKDGASAQSPTPEAGTPTATPSPEAPNRMDCLAIKGTPYLSPEEGTWYAANCARFDGPAIEASGSAQVNIGDTLVIGGASISAPITRATVPESGQMPDPVGYFNAVWYDFSKFDGYGGYANAGNLILSGHVDCARCVNGGSGRAIFWSIRNMKVGDTAQYQTADGKMLNYVVVESKDLSPNGDWEAVVASTAADMTLITCTGTFSGGEYNLRHVVHLKKV